MRATLLRLRKRVADGEFEYWLAVPVLRGCERVRLWHRFGVAILQDFY